MMAGKAVLRKQVVHAIEAHLLLGEEKGGAQRPRAKASRLWASWERVSRSSGVLNWSVCSPTILPVRREWICTGAVDRFGEHQGGAAGSVFFLRMVRFDEVDVGMSGVSGRLDGQFAEKGHPEREVRE